MPHERPHVGASDTDGLQDTHRIIAAASAHVTPDDGLLQELGWDQAAAVRGLLTAGGFAQGQSGRDLDGVERCSGGLRLV